MARFVARCAMRWSDMDAYGHVNNTAYLAYLEQARVSMFFDRYESSFARGVLVTHHEITYLRPVVYHPEPLRLELWVERVRAASFDVRYDVYDGQTLAAKAVTTLVTFDFTTDRPRRLTPEEKAILNSYLDEPAAPVGPTRPAAPVEPTGPAAPVEPTELAGPAEPTKLAAPDRVADAHVAAAPPSVPAGQE